MLIKISMKYLTIVLAAVTLAGCSEYLDRTDTMSRQSGNAVQTAKLTEMVDPWPVVPGSVTSRSTAP